MTKIKGELTALSVSISFAEGAKSEAMAYLFDNVGRLIQAEPVRPELTFEVDPQRSYRVLVGPAIEQAELHSNLADRLRNAGALGHDVHLGGRDQKLAFHITEPLSHLWLGRSITIHGIVRKHLNPGGTPPMYAPVTTGIVQTFTIDLAGSLDNLSDSFMVSMRQTILARMFGVEIEDLITFNFADFARLSALSAGLYTLTGNALRHYIVVHRAELAPFMGELIPESAIVYRQLPDAQIQSDGSFSLTQFFFFWELPVDLYFEVVQTIDGVTREVADPDIATTTMWAYDGTQGAVITVEDPSAIAGIPSQTGPAYLYVWPTAIGNVDLRQIDGIESMSGTGLLPGDTPFGGTLSLQMEFDPNLRSNGIDYYRWSYKFDGDADYTQINAPVTHRWMQVIPTGTGIDVHLNAVNLGPNLVGGQSNLYAIPDLTLPWVDIDDPADRPFAYFDSTTGQAGRNGMVTLKLEMFDSSGNHLPSANASHGGQFTYLLPDLMAPTDYTDAPGANIDADGNLVFRIRVDNRPCSTSIGQAHVGGNVADDCGMLHFGAGTDVVSVPYSATQAGGFLDWSLSVSRGSHGVVASAGGNNSTPSGTSLDRAASTLLDSCPQAAFAVNLYAAARATNGYGRQSQYDSSSTEAFALLHP